jgi:hypothetical protein
VVLFRGSSRAHRVLVEAGFALLVAGPCAAFGLADDLNRGLDASSSVVEASITDTEHRVTRSRKGGTRHSYYVTVSPEVLEGPPLGPKIQVTSSIFSSAHKGGTLRATLGRGALGATWIKKLEAY